MHSQSWALKGRGKAGQRLPGTQQVILLPSVRTPSRFCGPRQRRCEHLSGCVCDGPECGACLGGGGRVRAGRFPAVFRQARRLRLCRLCGELMEAVRILRCPDQCELDVLTWERRLGGPGSVGCGDAGRAYAGHEARPTHPLSARPAARRHLLEQQLWDFVPASSKADQAAGAGQRKGAPARRRMPGEKWRKAPPLSRL